MRASPAARSILEEYFKCQTMELYDGMLSTLSDHASIAEMHFENVLAGASSGLTETAIHKELLRSKDEYNRAAASTDNKLAVDYKADAAAVIQFGRLRELQAELQASSGREGFIGRTVIETIQHCLRLGMKEQAQKLGREFKVPEKQFLLMSIYTYAAQNDWTALQHMAGKLDRRAPITIDHFIAAVQAHAAPAQVVRWFADKLVGDDAIVKKAQIYHSIGLRSEAAMLIEEAELQGAASAGVLAGLRGLALGGWR